MPISPMHRAAHILAAICYGIDIPELRLDVTAETCPVPILPTAPGPDLDRAGYFGLKALAVVFLAGAVADLKAQGADLQLDHSADDDARSGWAIAEWLSAVSALPADALFAGQLIVMTSELLDVWKAALASLVSAAETHGSLDADAIRAVLDPEIAKGRRASAIHESGHAVMLWSEGHDQVPLTMSVGRLPAESSTNWTQPRDFSDHFRQTRDLSDADDRRLAELELRRLVAGEEAAKLVDPDYRGDIKARDDRHRAAALGERLAALAPPRTTDEVVERVRDEVRVAIQNPPTWLLIESLAAGLIKHETLGEGPIRDLLRGRQG